MASTAGAPLRIVSRRAAALRALHQPKQSRSGGKSSDGAGAKTDETPWPKSLRYAFYAACAAGVPYSAGMVVAQSPRLREVLLGDATFPPDAGDDASKGSQKWDAASLMEAVRSHWGVEEYVPPVDQSEMVRIRPGHGADGDEGDSVSSVLAFFGIGGSSVEASGDAVPISFANELPLSERRRQAAIDAELSPSNGNANTIKVRISTVRSAGEWEGGDGGDEVITDETVAKVPAYASLGSLRIGNNGVALPEEWRSTLGEMLGGKSDGRVRIALDFAPSDDDEGAEDGLTFPSSSSQEDPIGEEDRSPGLSAVQRWRRDTSIHSPWTRFSKDPASDTRSGGAETTSGVNVNAAPDNEQIHVMRLEHTISTLEADYNDPSSMRDRDEMMKELTSAKAELRELQRRRNGFWKRLWG